MRRWSPATRIVLDVTTDTRLSRVSYLFHKSGLRLGFNLETCPRAAAQIAPDERVTHRTLGQKVGQKPINRVNWRATVRIIGNKYLKNLTQH